MLVYDAKNKMLINNGLDAHNAYGLLGTKPIIVIDVYEHAYYTDYGSKRAGYIDAFLENINWMIANKRLARGVDRRL